MPIAAAAPDAYLAFDLGHRRMSFLVPGTIVDEIAQGGRRKRMRRQSMVTTSRAAAMMVATGSIGGLHRCMPRGWVVILPASLLLSRNPMAWRTTR